MEIGSAFEIIALIFQGTLYLQTNEYFLVNAFVNIIHSVENGLCRVITE